jgi:hypothetical protein
LWEVKDVLLTGPAEPAVDRQRTWVTVPITRVTVAVTGSINFDRVQLVGLTWLPGQEIDAPTAKEAVKMVKNNKKCPECNKQVLEDEIYFVAPDEDGDYGESTESGELFRFHPNCWAQGECLGQLNSHTRWLIGLAARTLKTLRTDYPSEDVPESAACFMPELDHSLVGLLLEVSMLREQAARLTPDQVAELFRPIISSGVTGAINKP